MTEGDNLQGGCGGRPNLGLATIMADNDAAVRALARRRYPKKRLILFNEVIRTQLRRINV